MNTWKTLPMSILADVFNGKTPSKSEQRSSGHPVLKIKDVSDKEMFKGNFESFVSFDFANRFISKQLQYGDILLLNAAHNADYVGSKHYFVNDSDVIGALATGEWTIIRPKKEHVVPEILKYWFKLKHSKILLKDLVKGIHLYPKDVLTLAVPLPSLPEQQRIAAVLSAADALCQKRRDTLAWLDQLVKSTFYEMFYKNSARESWELCDIQSLAQTHKNSMRTGPFGSDLLHSEFVDEGISVIGIDNAVHNYFSWGEKRFITEEKYEKLKRYTLYPRDVIITIMGTTGRSAVVPEDIPLCINTKHLAAITFNPELANPYFISYSIHSGQDILEQIHLRNRGAIMSGLNLGIIKELKIRKPPIELQNRFETALLEIYARQKAYQESLQNLEALFDSLMYHAFQGHLVFSEEGIENLMAQMQAEAA